MVFGVVLSASRTGMVGIVLLTLWGVLDRRLTRATRVLLLAVAAALRAELARARCLGRTTGNRCSAAKRGSRRRRICDHALRDLGQHAAADRAAPVDRRRLRRVQLRLDADAVPGPADRVLRPHAQPAAAPGWWNSACRSPLSCSRCWRSRCGARSQRRVRAEGLERHAARGVHDGADDGAAQPARISAVVRVLPAAHGIGLRPVPRACARRGAERGTRPQGRTRRCSSRGCSSSLAARHGARLHARRRDLRAAGRCAPLAERIADGQRSWFFAHHADYAAATIAEQPVRGDGRVRARAALPARCAPDDGLGQGLARKRRRRARASHRAAPARVRPSAGEGVFRRLRHAVPTERGRPFQCARQRPPWTIAISGRPRTAGMSTASKLPRCQPRCCKLRALPRRASCTTALLPDTAICQPASCRRMHKSTSSQ